MLLSETYKKRLKELAGIKIISEADAAIVPDNRAQAFTLSNQRIPFNKDLMIQAIQEGREVGILFQSKNDKYKMPVAKYRTIYPVAIGTSKAGNQVIRAVHRFGQSESAAIKSGVRSQEVQDEWRMFKVSNIKSMWFTGRFFSVPPKNYNAADKGMVNVEVAANFPKIQQFQKDLIQNAKQQEKPKPNIVSLFKPKEEPQKTVVPLKPTGTIKPKKTNSKEEPRLGHEPIVGPL